MKLHYVVSVASVLGAVLSFNVLSEAKANVADDLNTNYNKIVDNCGGTDKPSFLCSGNIIRLTQQSTSYHTWDPSPGSITRGGVSFMFLRNDINLNNFANVGSPIGIIYYPSYQQPKNKKNAEVSCIFPTDGWSDRRPDGGCGASTTYPNTSQRCQEQNIYTADEWYKHFSNSSISGNSVFQNQCGFDMTNKFPDTADALNQTIKAHNMVADYGGLTEYGYSEILIKTSPTNDKGQISNPQDLPIQAFFYMNNSGLSSTQYFQQDYYNSTGIIIPIVRLNMSEGFPKKISYSYSDSDQKLTIADQLNTNYNKVVVSCGSKNNPAYNCSGVLIRQASYNSNYHVWDPSPGSIARDGVSFSYLRKDIHLNNLMQMSRYSGFIYYPAEQTSQDIDKAKVSCAFPFVGWSDHRPYGGCGASTTYPTTSHECQQQGIYTADDWYKHFSSVDGVNAYQNQCAFDVSNCGHDTANAFNEFINAHNMGSNAGGTEAGSNEVIIRASETNINGQVTNPEKLPLQAFFYNNQTGLMEAQAYQQDYYNTTGKVVPVVYMNITDLNNITFEYKVADQVDLKKKLISPNN